MKRGARREESVVFFFTLAVSLSRPSSLFLPKLLAYVATDALTCNSHTHTTKATDGRKGGGEGRKKNGQHKKQSANRIFFRRIKKSFPGAHVRPAEIDFGLF